MSSSRRSRCRKSKPVTGETYSRADEALWDDAYLLRLFNEQLDNNGAIRDTHSETEDKESSVLSAVSEESNLGKRIAASAMSSSTSSSKGDAPSKRGRSSANRDFLPRGCSILNELPKDVAKLVQSFYNAGFEAGRYIGRAETSETSSRKRHR
ncbi:hypothetical protein JKF63_02543 [Porcisia hertigi]|uniref:Uncharacterized protein n=1 Tax=Porcisia hertigi TaxID=2761500 RepID=A0A836H9Q0_9TRYP|nr:hypothetical protein JKF63_02543 [Porcisia hertigi]